MLIDLVYKTETNERQNFQKEPPTHSLTHSHAAPVGRGSLLGPHTSVVCASLISERARNRSNILMCEILMMMVDAGLVIFTAVAGARVGQCGLYACNIIMDDAQEPMSPVI